MLLMADAGADALELNIFMLATDPGETAQAIEDRTVAMDGPPGRRVSPPSSRCSTLAGQNLGSLPVPMRLVC